MAAKERVSSNASSLSSTFSFDSAKFSDESYGTIEIPLSNEPSPESRVGGLREHARHHLRRFCRRKSFKTVATTTPYDLEFSYAVIPSALAFQESTAAAADIKKEAAAATALIIDCNNPHSRIQHTLECALRIFPRENIFVVGNGNSESSINKISGICAWFGVRYIWTAPRSKAVAQYVGVVAARPFRYCLLIDDDYALPPNFHVVTDWIESCEPEDCSPQTPVKGIGYAPEPTGIQDLQIQDLRYRLSRLPESLFGRVGEVGAAAFPHGKVSLWDRSLLEECFHRHPGYKASPNWFLGINTALVLRKKSVDSRQQSSRALLC